MQENKPVLIVGLGNPGPSYALTRHNAGFMVVDSLAPGDAVWKKEKNALVTKLDIAGQRIIIAKPQTFMNNSGIAVLSLMTFYKIPLENLTVIHDDIDLKLGDVRQKIGGGSAGHNGIKSIDGAVGKEYNRVRIGVGHSRDTHPDMDTSDWVLGKFTAPEYEKIKSVIADIKLADAGL